MPKEKKAKVAKKPKSEGRKPTLAPYVKERLAIFGEYKGKKFEAHVRADGMMIFNDKEFTSPSLACMSKINADGKDRQVNGWLFWKFRKDGKEVSLNVLRGKVKAAKPAKEKKAAAPKKPKAIAAPKKRRSAKGPKAPSGANAPSAPEPVDEPREEEDETIDVPEDGQGNEDTELLNT